MERPLRTRDTDDQVFIILWNKINMRKTALRFPQSKHPDVSPRSSITSSTWASLPWTFAASGSVTSSTNRQRHSLESETPGKRQALTQRTGSEQSLALTFLNASFHYSCQSCIPKGFQRLPARSQRSRVTSEDLLKSCPAFRRNNSRSLHFEQAEWRPLLPGQSKAGHRSEISCCLRAAKCWTY